MCFGERMKRDRSVYAAAFFVCRGEGAPAGGLFFGRGHIGQAALAEAHAGIELGEGHGALGGLQDGDAIAVGGEAAPNERCIIPP